MNRIQLAWKNLISKPSRFLFLVLMMATSFSLVNVVTLINEQFGQHFGRTSEGIDLILGAKGSPLQSVFCNVMHVDAPTGNLQISDIKPFLNKKHPLIETATPMALGDSYEGFRLVGTTIDYFETFKLSLLEGQNFQHNREVVLGFEVAQKLGKKIGDSFRSDHGLVEMEEAHSHELSLTVKGILKYSGSIQDRLIYSNISTYWELHSTHPTKDFIHEETDSGHVHEEHHVNDHPVNTIEDLGKHNGEITSILIGLKSKNIAALNFGRQINENTNIMAVNPAIEINRLYEMTGSASEILYFVGILIAALTLFSIFINLVQALEDRQKDMALLRLSGAGAMFISIQLFIELILIFAFGVGIGFLLSHGFLFWASDSLELGNKYQITGMYFCKEELYLVFLTLAGTVVSGLYPLYRSYNQDISKIFSGLS